ncbi:MAG: hypothetical protein HGA19_07585 [Oscillochloris sp.]|nr:hypothetical protein [Oscillochloris sp.]
MRQPLNHVGAILHGFALRHIQWVEEAQAWAQHFVHLKTQAQVLYLSNEDSTNVFSITFRTPASDNSGKTHILEHAVLCGSRKFPVRAPIREVLKGSLQTYLNARTSSDRTTYVFATRNSQDFINLMDVHLDAVFFPRFHVVPEILEQEGWHREVEEKTGAVRYTGVVLNEMRATFAAPGPVLRQMIRSGLFPDSTYGFIFAGDPPAIPETTQAALQHLHRMYYHPSNSFIFMYGDGDLEARLQFLDEAYLRHFRRRNINARIVLQAPFKAPRERNGRYLSNDDAPPEGRMCLSLSYALGRSTDAEQRLAFEMLNQMLLGSATAPFRQMLLAAGTWLDLWGEFDASIWQCCFSIIATGCSLRDRQRLKQAVTSNLRKIVDTGLDASLVNNGIARVEFAQCESEVPGEPTGFSYNLRILDSWLYNGDPLAHIAYGTALERIKHKAGAGYFEGLIKTYLLDNNHQVLVALAPGSSVSWNDSERAPHTAGMVGQSETLPHPTLLATDAHMPTADRAPPVSQEERERIRNDHARLESWWNTSDTLQGRQSIPLLTLNDLQAQAPIPGPSANEYTINGVTFLQSSAGKRGIVYLDLYFDTSAVPQELIEYVPLLAHMLGTVDTENYEHRALSSNIATHSGGFQCEATAIGDKASLAHFYPNLIVRAKALTGNTSNLLKLISEILLRSRFTAQSHMHQLIYQARAKSKAALDALAPVVAMERAASCFSPYHRYRDLIAGFSYYHFLSKLDDQWGSQVDAVEENLKKVATLIFVRSGLLAGVTAAAADFQSCIGDFAAFIERLPVSVPPRQLYDFVRSAANEGIIIPGTLQTVTCAGDFRRAGYAFSGRLLVLSTVLNGSYLWDEIRLRGGAYGAFMRIERYGLIGCFSYGDPHLARTLRVYKHISDYLQHLNLSKHDMTANIIGTLSRLDRPVHARETVPTRISGITQADVKQTREEVLATELADIRDLAALCQQAMHEPYLCVLGSAQALQDNAELFGSIATIDQI